MGESEVVGIHGEEVRGRTRDEERGRQVGKQISKKNSFQNDRGSSHGGEGDEKGGWCRREGGGGVSLFSTNSLGEDPPMLPPPFSSLHCDKTIAGCLNVTILDILVVYV